MSNIDDKNDSIDDDDMLTIEEQNKITALQKKQNIDIPIVNVPAPITRATMFKGLAAAFGGVTKEPIPFDLIRRVGLNPVVTINNISGKKAWLILSPAPIMSIGSIGIDKIGQIAITTTGDYKCQQSAISNNTSIEFDLDNSQIYYTVFFDCDGKWKIPFKDKKINTRKYNINILERHVEDSIEVELIPIN